MFPGPLAYDYNKVLIHRLEKYVRVLFLVTEECIPCLDGMIINRKKSDFAKREGATPLSRVLAS